MARNKTKRNVEKSADKTSNAVSEANAATVHQPWILFRFHLHFNFKTVIQVCFHFDINILTVVACFSLLFFGGCQIYLKIKNLFVDYNFK